MCGAHHLEIKFIFSVSSAVLEENFGDNNLSVRDTGAIAPVENKVTGAAVFTSCTEVTLKDTGPSHHPHGVCLG